MQYNPELAIKYNLTGEDEKAYRLICVWVHLSRKIFPDYMHTKIPSISNLKKSILFRIVRKMMNERKYTDLEQYVYFIRAQLMVLKNYTLNSGNPVLIDPVILTGEGSERRWFFWKKLVAQANSLTRQVYTLQDSDMEFDLNVSLTEIKKICGDQITFDNFNANTLSIKTAIILRKIKPIYVYLSKWIKKLPKEMRKEFFIRSGAKSYEKCDTEFAEKIYNQIFDFENQ
jgi:hypothetical protein